MLEIPNEHVCLIDNPKDVLKKTALRSLQKGIFKITFSQVLKAILFKTSFGRPFQDDFKILQKDVLKTTFSQTL